MSVLRTKMYAGMVIAITLLDPMFATANQGILSNQTDHKSVQMMTSANCAIITVMLMLIV